MLADYPQEVIEEVTDPRTGLARVLKFLPAIAEIAEACEARMRPHRYAERSRRFQHEREARDRELATPPDAKAMADLVEHLRKGGGRA